MMLGFVATILALAASAPVADYSQTIAGWWLHPQNSTECRMEKTLPSGIWVAFSENPKNTDKGSFVMTGKWTLDRQGGFPITYSFDGWKTQHSEFAQGRNFNNGTAMVVVPTHNRSWYLLAVHKRVAFRIPAGNIDTELDLPDFSWVSTNLRFCNETIAK